MNAKYVAYFKQAGAGSGECQGSGNSPEAAIEDAIDWLYDSGAIDPDGGQFSSADEARRALEACVFIRAEG